MKKIKSKEQKRKNNLLSREGKRTLKLLIKN